MKVVLGVSGLVTIWPDASARHTTKPEGVLVNDVHTELNPTLVNRIVYPDSLNSIQETIQSARRERRVICIAGAKHAMGAQQFATGGVLIDTTTLNKVLNFNPEEGTIEVEAGIQWPILISYLLKAQEVKLNQWGIAQKQTADWLSMGGCLASNIHGRGLQMKPFIQDVESFVLIDANGKKFRCSREENPELFRLVIGGYGLFGIIYSVKLRLVPRQKVELVAEIISIEDLMQGFEKRISEGVPYATFLYNADAKSDDFLRKGILLCYRPVNTAKPVPDYEEQPSNEEWISLRYLAHTDKEQYFKKISDRYLASSGRVYWSDTHQLSLYVKGYHHQLDRMLHTPQASDISTEVYVPRESLTDFVDEASKDFRRNKVDVIFGEIGVIDQDKESFLAYAKHPYARISFHVHTIHNPVGIERTRQAHRRLIDMAAQREGSYYLTNHKFATVKQVKACYPQFTEFIRLKKKYDLEETFQSDWYRYHKEMFG